MWGFPLFPDQASTMAPRVDALYLGLVAFSGIIIVIVCFLVVFFGIRYRRGAKVDRHQSRKATLATEITWAIPTFVIAIALFIWSARVFVEIMEVPDESTTVYVVAKQWMWQFEHADGRREINELHVPVDETIKLLMTSEDVIHSLYVPAFRVKMDVLPRRYTTLWFRPTRAGEYHLFCAEYCGTEHAYMGGRVVVMEQHDYQEWLGRAGPGSAALRETTEALLESYGCNSCHLPGGVVPVPPLEGLFGSIRPLADGTEVIADEEYLRESILDPQAKIVAGYGADMPSYRGQMSERDLIRIIEYIKSLTREMQPGSGVGGQGSGEDEKSHVDGLEKQ